MHLDSTAPLLHYPSVHIEALCFRPGIEQNLLFLICKEEHRRESLKKGITLLLSLLLEKVQLLIFFFMRGTTRQQHPSSFLYQFLIFKHVVSL